MIWPSSPSIGPTGTTPSMRPSATGLIEAAKRAGEEARALVLTGAGKAFCSGADLNDLMADYESGDGPGPGSVCSRMCSIPLLQALLECKVPVIGAINGVAAGAGSGPGPRLRHSGDGRGRLSHLGIHRHRAGARLGHDVVAVAPPRGLPGLEIAFTNRRVGAEEARELGLCVDVVPGDQLLDRARSVAEQMADLVPDSLVTTRRLIQGCLGQLARRRHAGRAGRTGPPWQDAGASGRRHGVHGEEEARLQGLTRNTSTVRFPASPLPNATPISLFSQARSSLPVWKVSNSRGSADWSGLTMETPLPR